jgi:hypothetical protein
MIKLLLLLVASASALTVKKPAATPVLKLRGGLAGVDPDMVAKGVLALYAVNSAYVTLAPEPCADAYGMKSPTGLQVAFIENMGFLLTGMTIAGFMAMNGVDASKCLAAALIPTIISTAKWLLNGTGKKLGVPDTGNYLNGVIMAAIIASVYTGTGDPALVLKVASGWWALNGIVAAVMPDKLAGAYGLESVDKALTGLMQSFGAFLTNFAVFFASYGVLGNSAAKSIGLSSVAGALVQLDQMYGRKLGAELDQGPQLFWLAVNAAVVAFTVF